MLAFFICLFVLCFIVNDIPFINFFFGVYLFLIQTISIFPIWDGRMIAMLCGIVVHGIILMIPQGNDLGL